MTPTLTSDAVAGSGSTTAVRPGHSLLIVDDDPSVRHALWITFRETYNVQLADSGPKAIDSFKQSPADVVLLDIRMPGMSGLEVLRQLKEIQPEVEVILLSAYESIDYIRQAMRLGACDYITKPYELENLRLTVGNAMERREVSRKTSAYDKRLLQLQSEIQNQQMREELARTRNEIYASIIHDINGPLTVIAGYIELMQHSLQHAHAVEGDQLDTLKSHAQNIWRQVNNCVELSRRYLGFLEGKVSSAASSAIREIFYDVAELLKTHPQAKANDLVIQSCPEDVVAAINRTDLLQILLNLTINALQCSPLPHRVEVYAKVLGTDAPRPFLQTAPGTRFISAPAFPSKGPLVAVSVQDNGPGISEAILDKIFDPYFTTKPPGQGTGLGLSIVRRLVLQAQGAVHVYTHAGEATVFTIYIPLQSKP
jgi:two-component system, sensor histidine kinase and response regulator